MAFTIYDIPISTTADGLVDVDTLREQILAAPTILTALNSIWTEGSDVRVEMRDEIDGAELTTLSGVVSAHQGTVQSEVNIQLVAATKPELGEVWIHTPNWCDKTTWYPKSIRVTGEVLTPVSTSRTVFTSEYSHWIDLTHGKLADEDRLAPPFVPIVRVNGVVQSESEAFKDNPNNDFWIDYDTGQVHFLSPVPGGVDVTADYSYATSSLFIIQPTPGKQLLMQEAEAEFTTDFDMRDTVIYEGYAYAAVIASAMGTDVAGLQAYFISVFGSLEAFNFYIGKGLVPDPLEPLDKVPTGETRVYKTYWDFKTQSNGNYAPLPAIGGTLRGTRTPSITHPFNYKGVKVLKSSLGAEARVYLKNDREFGGGAGAKATATFYCLTKDE